MIFLYRIEKSMLNFERQHKIRRWTDASTEYKTVREMSNRIKQTQMMQRISTKSQERFFLLDVKAKYASKNKVYVVILLIRSRFCTYIGGHELSQKISKQITSITGSLKALVEKYNEHEWNKHPRVITMNEVCSRDVIWFNQASTSDIPASLRNQLIDAWHLQERAKEEIEMLKEEMKRTISNSLAEVQIVLDYIQSNKDSMKKGAICLCKQLLVKKSVNYLLYCNKFTEFLGPMILDIPLIPDQLLEACLEQVHVTGEVCYCV